MVHLEVADRDAVDSFENWYGPDREEWQKENVGSEHEIVDRWVGDNLPGYAKQLA